MSSTTHDWRSDYLARAVESALLRGRCSNQSALVAAAGPAADELDVRRMLMFWMIQRTMSSQPADRFPAALRAELAMQRLTVTEACECGQEPPADQELTAV